MLLGFAAQAQPATGPKIDPDGTLHVPAFALPESAYLSDESRAAMKYFREVYAKEFFTFSAGCGNLMESERTVAENREIRDCISEGYFQTKIYQDTLEKHPVDISAEVIEGVYTEVFGPKRGIDPKNRNRLLISIHGGGFVAGSRSFSHTEAMQVADIGRIRVISPDYRQAPEFRHPAAVEDVIAVYGHALERYEPENIGIFGCSAGAMLTAQVTAFMLQNDIPLPAAIGLYCAGIPMTMNGMPGAFKMSNGESAYLVSALRGSVREGAALVNTEVPPYFQGVAAGDPVVAPGDHEGVVARFPPTQLISGTRDFALSGVLASHQLLTRLGVPTDLHVWEGLGHATFAFNPKLPESDEVHNVIVDFFDTHLGR